MSTLVRCIIANWENSRPFDGSLTPLAQDGSSTLLSLIVSLASRKTPFLGCLGIDATHTMPSDAKADPSKPSLMWLGAPY
jgi:hypothetical protein